jgi:hypothetical protein
MASQKIPVAYKRKLVHSGTSYYVVCPYDGKTIWLSYEKEGDSVWCPKCFKQVKVGESENEKDDTHLLGEEECCLV